MIHLRLTIRAKIRGNPLLLKGNIFIKFEKRDGIYHILFLYQAFFSL
jgi:hypothetical protein